MTERVKYYSRNDLCYGMHLDKIEMLDTSDFHSMNINDAIELHEIERYFIDGARSKDWDDTTYQSYKAKSNELLKLCNRFFNQINDDNVIDLYNEIELGYHSVFWMLFDNCKLFNVISEETFANLIECDRVSSHDLFLYKNIVRKYGSVLRNYIIANEYCITILLHVYEQDYTESEKLTLPSELTGDDICSFIERYIDGEHPNANHLQTITNMQYSKQFPISDEIRLKAKRRYEKELENISETGVGLFHSIQISFDSEQDEIKIGTHNDCELSISYSTKWMLETLDYPSILNNFIYLFEFVDVPQMRCSHVNKVSQSGVFERVLASKSSRVYPHNLAFKFSNGIASMQMHAYYEFLAKQNIRLEDVLQWFFTEQIQSEFGCAEMRISMPSPNISYAEKCYVILSAFESVLKQFYLYVKNGEIDFELVGMSTTPIMFKNIKSFVKDKYIYGVGEDYKRLCGWFFSDQCTFAFVRRIHDEGRNYERFLDLLLNETVYISDYRESEHGAFNNMAEYDLIAIDEVGKINLKDTTKLAILRDLFENDVISRWHYPSNAEKAIRDFEEKHIIETKSTLFSQPEIDYLNYLLNRSEYCNGLEIRNRYIHGIQQVNTNEEEHKQNYFVLLRLFILLAIKINDELCLKEQEVKTIR